MKRRKQEEVGWKCPECGARRVRDNSGLGQGVDPCLGRLPGVKAACCGHGGKGDGPGYIYFTNGKIIRFDTCTVD